MIRRKRIVLGLAVVLLIPLLALAWWLGSPLFLDKTISEEFPAVARAAASTSDEIAVAEGMITPVTAEARMEVAPTATVSNEPMAQEERSATIADEIIPEATLETPTRDEIMAQGTEEQETEAVPAEVTPDPAGESEMSEDDSSSEMTSEPEAVPELETATEPEVTPEPEIVSEAEATVPVLLKSGTFRDGEPLHHGSGQVSIYQLPDGSRILRLENFNVTNGPDLHVYLSAHPNPTSSAEVRQAGYVDLGSLKGNVGDQNYQIPADVDLNIQVSVVIYCQPFHVIFSVASLTEAG